MDDALLAEFQSTFLIGGDVVTAHGPIPHRSLYKQRGDGFGSQEARRKKFLEEQKVRRRNYADYARRVVEGDLLEEDDEMEEGAFDDIDQGAHKKDTKQQAKAGEKREKKKKRNPYNKQLMLSEWMIDVPEDFEENWKFVVCPIGKRCLVISNYGTTTAYSRSGEFFKNFPSLLPGGCAHTYRLAARDYCILDCIYHEISRVFHVLDVMCWGGHPVYDSDMEFRIYWKETKLHDEGDRLGKYSRINPLTFKNLDYYPCTKEKLSEVLGGKWSLEVDGLLFIHKGAHYTTGRSPLAAWLKPQMVQEVLKIPVSEEFLSCAPTLPIVMETISSEKKSKKTRSKKNGSEKMDSSPCTASSDTAAATSNASH